MGGTTTLIWFRNDLRLDDHPALAEASSHGCVVPVFIWAPEEEGNWQPGAASRWWLHQSLASLDEDLRRLGSRLVLRRGPTASNLRDLVQETHATAVFWNRRYEPSIAARDDAVARSLVDAGIETKSFNGSLLFEPWSVSTRSGGPYQVFTPFWKRCLSEADPSKPQAAPSKLAAPPAWPRSESLNAFRLEPEVDWAAGLREQWAPGGRGARRRLNRFVETTLQHYQRDRDRLDHDTTSALSPHLHFGELSPRQVWQAVGEARREHPHWSDSCDAFLRQLGWREFAYHLIHHFPQTSDAPLKAAFENFPWQRDRRALRRWQKGQTGVPLVDAAMRQLWRTGWMPNRTRLVVASYLTKNLLVTWREGARWFWDTLVDADLANNTLGWQWTAGCGADAAPFFRVLNPVAQGERFDPAGDYIRKWVPELAALPRPWVFKPWEAPQPVLRDAGVVPGKTYPRPLFELKESRERALAAYQAMRRA